MIADFYRGKRILLTGHTGFKGTWMSIMLKELGAVVCGYSLPVNAVSFFKEAGATVDQHVEGDITDRECVRNTVWQFQPEMVIHMASHSSLDGSEKIPDFILRTNIEGLINLLEVVRQTDSVKAILIVTSDKCYKNINNHIPYKENSILDGDDPYSTSKVCQELLSKCYLTSFFIQRGLSLATARASNVIGYGDYNISRLLPYLLSCYCNGHIPNIRNPKAVRPWQYVLDVDYGYLLLLKKLYEDRFDSTISGAYNFGPSQAGFIEVGKIAEYIGEYFNHAGYNVAEGQVHTIQETDVLKLDSSKAIDLLGWKARYSIKKAIGEIVSIEFSKQNNIDLHNIATTHIQKYLGLVGVMDK